MIRINFNNPFNKKGVATPEEKARIFELKQQAEKIEKDIKEKEKELSNNLDSLSPRDKVEHMREIIELQNQKRESNRARIDLEKEIREGRTSSKNKEEEKPQTPEEKIESFLKEYKLEDKMPIEFADMSVGQKMFVIENTKKRIVDIVKGNAETQYSEYYKKKMATLNNKEAKWLHQEIGKAFRKGGASLKESMLKEGTIKDLESDAFRALIYGKEGGELLQSNLDILIKNAKEQEISYDQQTGKTRIMYETYSRDDGQEYTIEERQVIVDFNRTANEFRNIPYEWGQENKVGLGKNKNKKKN